MGKPLKLHDQKNTKSDREELKNVQQEVSSESVTRIIISENTVSSINMDSRIDEILVSKDSDVRNENSLLKVTVTSS